MFLILFNILIIKIIIIYVINNIQDKEVKKHNIYIYNKINIYYIIYKIKINSYILNV